MTSLLPSDEDRSLPQVRWAYGKPEAKGELKHVAGDFRVTELPLYELSGRGEHAYLDVEKTNANTSWVAAQIAKHAGISSQDVGYAGRKDRKSVSRQWFSCYLPSSEPDWNCARHSPSREAHRISSRPSW